MVIGTVTTSKPAVLPVRTRVEREQKVFEGGDGTIRARSVGAEARLLTYNFRSLPRTDIEDLDDFLTGVSGANFRGNVFSITDDWGTSYSVRWWDARLDYVEKVGRLFDLTITFRVEN